MSTLALIRVNSPLPPARQGGAGAAYGAAHVGPVRAAAAAGPALQRGSSRPVIDVEIERPTLTFDAQPVGMGEERYYALAHACYMEELARPHRVASMTGRLIRAEA